MLSDAELQELLISDVLESVKKKSLILNAFVFQKKSKILQSIKL